ncbi:hypothetical protein ASPSYDRAFT_83391 [Aspergillus sydowii CBS 593.65]|uniref:Uncharacterized protein n=1 Tax=Aspergillus sydowii CBS 593.65 TaxID=1036612 RepID=A0A1L9TV77_9EURO|nr:uncharacterized protein ASPSYDRAFT_83391 [Aspergillus sydowii CBS 593.65]OJJ63321.1 hypothetical protein ASPSYDRAFT_83391 [Aspergillus sydowii CBS 593.65]
MAKAEDEKGTFRKSMREMHNDETKAWKEKIEVFDRQFCEQIAEKGYELKDLEESVREENEFEDHEEMVRNVLREVSEANGIAAGVTTSVITGGTLLCTVM